MPYKKIEVKEGKTQTIYIGQVRKNERRVLGRSNLSMSSDVMMRPPLQKIFSDNLLQAVSIYLNGFVRKPKLKNLVFMLSGISQPLSFLTGAQCC